MHINVDRYLDRLMKFAISGRDGGKCPIAIKASDIKRSLVPSPVSLTVPEFDAGIVHGRIPSTTLSSFIHEKIVCCIPIKDLS